MDKLKLSAMALGVTAATAFAQDTLSTVKTSVSGEVELDVYTSDTYASGDLKHHYATTADLNLDFEFNSRWSAHLGLEADGEIDNIAALYNGAYIQYKRSKNFSIKLGDLTFSEGAFTYYRYDDAAINAAGMKEQDIRGVQVQLRHLELGLGFARGENESDKSSQSYIAHVAYQQDMAGQTFRPYIDYKSYQEARHNEIHAGLDTKLALGGFSLHGVYGYHSGYHADHSKLLDMTSYSHALLLEPSFNASFFSMKGAFFYAFINANDIDTMEGTEFHRGNNAKTFDRRNGDDGEIPEYMFVYAEPAFRLAEIVKLGIPVEFHTNALDSDADISSLDIGGRLYLTPVENLDITGIAMWSFPVGEKNKDDISLTFGLETTFSF